MSVFVSLLHPLLALEEQPGHQGADIVSSESGVINFFQGCPCLKKMKGGCWGWEPDRSPECVELQGGDDGDDDDAEGQGLRSAWLVGGPCRMLNGRCASRAYLEALKFSGKSGLTTSDESPAKSANNGFCQTVWDISRILMSVLCLLDLLIISVSFHFHRSYMFHFTRLPLSPCIHETLDRQPVFGDHSRSDRRRWGTVTDPPLGEQLRNVTQPQLSLLKRLWDALGRGQEAGFPGPGGCIRGERGAEDAVYLMSLPSGGTSVKSHQEGLSSFLHSNARKRWVSVICFKKRFYYLVTFALRKSLSKLTNIYWISDVIYWVIICPELFSVLYIQELLKTKQLLSEVTRLSTQAGNSGSGKWLIQGHMGSKWGSPDFSESELRASGCSSPWSTAGDTGYV